MARSGRIEARNDIKVNSTSVVLTTDIRLIKQSGDYSVGMVTGLPEALSSIQARLDEKQDANSRLTTFSNQATPSVPKIPQLNPDGTISFIDVPSGGGGGSTAWATPGEIGSTTPNTGNFTTLTATSIQAHVPSIAVTADKTLALSDRNTRQVYSSTTTGTITIPADATVAFLDSTSVEITKEGTGNITIVPAAGVTFKRDGDVTLASVTITDRYASVFFIKAGANDWRVFGLSNAIAFADIASKPTTLAGYGITDALSLGETSDLVYETKDHYLTGGLVASSPVGALGLIPFASGTGAGFGSGLSTATNPGVISFNTGTTATGHSIFRSNVGTLQFGAAIYKLKSIVSLSALPNGTDSFNVRFGFGDAGNGGAAIVDGAFFYADQANANWICRTSSNSVVTSTTTTVPVSTSFTTLEVVVNKAGTSVTFSINGTVVATHTTNIPTGTGRETGITYAIAKTVGVTNVFFSLDFAKFYMDGR